MLERIKSYKEFLQETRKGILKTSGEDFLSEETINEMTEEQATVLVELMMMGI